MDLLNTVTFSVTLKLLVVQFQPESIPGLAERVERRCLVGMSHHSIMCIWTPKDVLHTKPGALRVRKKLDMMWKENYHESLSGNA